MKMRVLSVMLLAVAATAARPKIVFGGTVSRTGGLAKKGNQMEQGYLTAQKYFNEPGPGLTVNNVVYDIELQITDDASDKPTVEAQYKLLGADAAVHFLLGPYSSGMVDVASDAAEPFDKVMVEGMGASNYLFEKGTCDAVVGACDGATITSSAPNRCTAAVCTSSNTFTPYKNLFATCNRASSTADPALKAFKDAGAASVMFAHKEEAYASAVNAGAREYAATLGYTIMDCDHCSMVVHEDTPAEREAKYKVILTEAAAQKPDVFFNFGHFEDAVAYTKVHVADGFVPKGTFMSASVADHVTYLAAPGVDGDAPLDTVGNSMWEPTMRYSGDYFGTAAEFATAYEAIGDVNAMTYQGAGGTISFLALAMGIKEAGSITDHAAVRTALNALDVDTFWGNVNFQTTGAARGYNAGHKMGTIQLQFNQKHTIAPEHAKEREVRYPSQEYCAANADALATDACSTAVLYNAVVTKLEAVDAEGMETLTALFTSGGDVDAIALKAAITSVLFAADKVDSWERQPQGVKNMYGLGVITQKDAYELNGQTMAGDDTWAEHGPSGTATEPVVSSSARAVFGLLGLLCLAF